MRVILFVFIFNTLYSVTFAQSAHSCIFCHYGGALAKDLQGNNFTFSIDEVPKRCDVVGYGNTNFNSRPEEEDAKAITELKSAGKTVYMLYMYPVDVNWTSIISSTDPSILDNHIAPMLTYVNENKIDGVILAYLDLLSGEIPDYTNKINGLLCKIKESAPNLKISILVNANDPTDYSKKELFDFTVIDSLVDIYFIDLTLKNYCDASTIAANGGRLPLTSTGTNDTRVTLEQECTNVTTSGMDVNKLYVALNSAASRKVPDQIYDILPYSEYCAGPISKTGVYCLDSMQLFYDRAQYAKKYFKGMIISEIDFDDYDNSCCCGLFPVANTYIDGWMDQPLKSCDKIG